MLFDIVIPLGPNERCNILNQLTYVKKNVIGYRNIYIITNNYDDLKIDGCVIIDESIFPFKMNDIGSFFKKYNNKKNRNGWYLQQLLKLYAGFVIEDILENYLVIDADVFFLKPINFFEDKKYIFTHSNENHIPYFDHMARLHPSFSKKINVSGISHHMIFNTHIIKEIFSMVETLHNKPFWIMFIESVNEHTKYDIDREESGASEYEIYFNYIIHKHPDIVHIRSLKWENKPSRYNINIPSDLDYVSICHYI